MGWTLAALSAGWLAAMVVVAAACLPAAALTKLLPARYGRLSAVLWQAVAALGWGVLVAVLFAAPVWFSDPPLYAKYSPHLERVLPHVCFRVVRDTVGGQYLCGASVLMVGLLALGAGRLVVGLRSARKASAALRATAHAGAGPDGKPVLLSAKAAATQRLGGQAAYLGQPAMTVGFLRPVVILAPGPMASMPPSAAAAVVAHERDHVRWRDPLTQLLLAATSWCFPGLGWIVATNWRRHSEHAADAYARATAGEEAWREAMRALSGDDGGILLEDRLAVTGKPTSVSPAIAAAGGWALLVIAAWPIVYPYVAMSLFCWIETTWHSWG